MQRSSVVAANMIPAVEIFPIGATPGPVAAPKPTPTSFNPLANIQPPHAFIGPSDSRCPAGVPGWADAGMRKRLGGELSGATDCWSACGSWIESGRKRPRPASDASRSAPMEPPDYIYCGAPASAGTGGFSEQQAGEGCDGRLDTWLDPVAPPFPSPFTQGRPPRLPWPSTQPPPRPAALFAPTPPYESAAAWGAR